MRMMMLVQFPAEPFNTLARNGTVGATMKKILDDAKPEAAYFSERDGKRGCVLIVDVPGGTDIPRLAEPWFLNFNAEVEFRICCLRNWARRIWKRWGRSGAERGELASVPPRSPSARDRGHPTGHSAGVDAGRTAGLETGAT